MTKVFRMAQMAATDDFDKIRQLTLPGDADDDNPVTFHDEDGNDYQVPADTIFISINGLFQVDNTSAIVRIGESDAGDGAITREVVALTGIVLGLAASEWGNVSDGQMVGVFRAGKYVTAETHTSSYKLITDSVLYGIEVPLTGTPTHAIRMGGNAITSLGSELEILILPSNAKDDVPITFHDLAGSDYQVPVDTVFVPIYLRAVVEDNSRRFRIGESAAGDGAIATERIAIEDRGATDNYPYLHDPELIFTFFEAETYVTGETDGTNAGDELVAGTLLVGLEFSTA